MGLNGRQFSERHKDIVLQMQRSMLDFIKSAQLRSRGEAGEDQEAADEDSESASAGDLKMTEEGYPILPKGIFEQNLSKKKCEDICRAYLAQHYCENHHVFLQ